MTHDTKFTRVEKADRPSDYMSLAGIQGELQRRGAWPPACAWESVYACADEWFGDPDGGQLAWWLPNDKAQDLIRAFLAVPENTQAGQDEIKRQAVERQKKHSRVFYQRKAYVEYQRLPETVEKIGRLDGLQDQIGELESERGRLLAAGVKDTRWERREALYLEMLDWMDKGNVEKAIETEDKMIAVLDGPVPGLAAHKKNLAEIKERVRELRDKVETLRLEINSPRDWIEDRIEELMREEFSSQEEAPAPVPEEIEVRVATPVATEKEGGDAAATRSELLNSEDRPGRSQTPGHSEQWKPVWNKPHGDQFRELTNIPADWGVQKVVLIWRGEERQELRVFAPGYGAVRRAVRALGSDATPGAFVQRGDRWDISINRSEYEEASA